MRTTMVPIEDLVEDFSLYPRRKVSITHVTALVDAIQAGEYLPAVVIERATKRVVDGFHRVRACRRLGLPQIDCEMRDYKSEADLFADAVRMNASHGRPFGPFDKRHAVEILRRLGVADKKIVQIVKAPIERIIEITSNFAVTEDGEEHALKAPHIPMLGGETITSGQVEGNRRRDGMVPTYHANQLILALENGLWRPTPGFVAAMNKLVGLWKGHAPKRAA